jgi:hypothetical protein
VILEELTILRALLGPRLESESLGASKRRVGTTVPRFKTSSRHQEFFVVPLLLERFGGGKRIED